MLFIGRTIIVQHEFFKRYWQRVNGSERLRGDRKDILTAGIERIKRGRTLCLTSADKSPFSGCSSCPDPDPQNRVLSP